MEDSRMSQGDELAAAHDDSGSRPSFETALRGYDKRQVDQYLARTDHELAQLGADRERAYAQIQQMVPQLKHLQAELNERQRQPLVERASFRHLGPMVDQILALAEKQAEAIVHTANQQITEQQSAAEKVLAETHDRAQKVRAESEALAKQSQQQAEQARVELEASVEEARNQLQQEVEAARAKAEQELAQWKATVEKELADHKTAVEGEIVKLRNAADQKNAQLHAEAQQFAADLRRRASEQAASHQQQLAVVQQELQTRQQALTELQAQLETTQQALAETQQKGEATENELNEMQRRLGEVRNDLTSELARLDEARNAAETAERRATETRARVQREAKRVADLAAAAVMAAAAHSADTGEYRMVPVRTDGPHAADEPALEAPAEAARRERPMPMAGNGHPRREANGHGRTDVEELRVRRDEHRARRDGEVADANGVRENGQRDPGNGHVRPDAEPGAPIQRHINQEPVSAE